MKILVTGGAGYIGSHTVYELIEQGYEVFILDNLSTGNREAVHKGATLFEGDQLDEVFLEEVFSNNKFDLVMHFSAKLIVPESIEFPELYQENNVGGITKLLRAMKKHGVKNIVFSSTAAVYGDATKMPIEEDDVKNPINPYGATKLECEHLIQESGINYVIFRYFNVAGAHESGAIGQSTKGRQLTHLIPVVIEAALGIRDELVIYGNDYDTKDGTCVRDYIHVVDLAKAHVSGAEYVTAGKSNIFNLGSKEGYSVKDVVDATEELGIKVPHTYGPRRGDGDPARLIASNDRAIKELDFHTTYSLEDMIKSDKDWRENKKF